MYSELPDADIVIVALPVNGSTSNLVDDKFFTLMKNDSILVNVSRGDVINETDLINHLRRKKFHGVALDVFQNEPLESNNELWGFSNVYITPHNSFVSDKTDDRLFSIIKKNLSIRRD